MYVNPKRKHFKHFNMNSGDQPLQEKNVDENMDEDLNERNQNNFMAKKVYVSQKPKISIPN